MQVLKFGGTSVAKAENIEKVISIVTKAISKEPTVVVVSALGGITDILLDSATIAASGSPDFAEKISTAEKRHFDCVSQLIGNNPPQELISFIKNTFEEIKNLCNGILLLNELTPRSKDRIAGYGELLSSKIITAAFIQKSINANWLDARKLIVTNSAFGAALVDFDVTNQKINEAVNEHGSNLFIVPGFIASDTHGVSTTLGRGGSDYTAAIFAAAVSASNLEIWTDVSGMMTADPRLSSNAKIIPYISYQEAMELSHFGAKVIYPPTIQPVMSKHIPVWIKNTFAPDDFGTMISSQHSLNNKNNNIITGISSINNICLITLEGSGMVGIPGFSKRLFEALSNEKINVILITQSSSEHSITVAIDSSMFEKAKSAVDVIFSNEIALGKVDPLILEKDLSIVALVGENMENHTGVSGRMFSAMGRNGINIRAIAQGSSEKNISAVIFTKDVKKTINILHEEFFETTYKQVNVFLAGAGNVGKKLLSQLKLQSETLQKNLHLNIRLTGIINSKKMLINESGIDAENWEQLLSQGTTSDINEFAKQIIDLNLRNTVFVDITAHENVANVYEQLLEKSIAVVACNKIAASSAYSHYKKLKQLAREYNTQFLFETNVGAGLPIIGTINDLIHSGDKINKIEAVLSGTLNFVFNNYNGTKSFAEVVKMAQDEGYTEPDPRLDLGGKDVMRKIMILAREAGEHLEMEAIENNSFMPEACMQGSVDEFYASMEKFESHFKSLYDDANANGNKLKFVASFENSKASVGLQQIHPNHDLYNLFGKDNIVLFYTDRYKEQPLVIKGAGAGAEVTASGVFADIIRASKI
ncbi:MAG: bifunctional aspartate kinase/homoserine dehydrogenase I [Sphingobacteriales bacterium]|nr:bifunctional aspartate kinase/homoserine dehydrogenase I [Sphingobacteriales bacterium]